MIGKKKAAVVTPVRDILANIFVMFSLHLGVVYWLLIGFKVKS